MKLGDDDKDIDCNGDDSLGLAATDRVLRSPKGPKGASISMSDYGFPVFRCARQVTMEDVKSLDDEE